MYTQLCIESMVGQRRKVSLVTTNMGLCYLKWNFVICSSLTTLQVCLRVWGVHDYCILDALLPQKVGQSGVPRPHQRNISILCGYVDLIKENWPPQSDFPPL